MGPAQCIPAVQVRHGSHTMLRLRKFPEVFDGFVLFTHVDWVVHPTPRLLPYDEQFQSGRVPSFMRTDQEWRRGFQRQPLGESGRLVELEITRLELMGQQAMRTWQR